MFLTLYGLNSSGICQGSYFSRRNKAMILKWYCIQTRPAVQKKNTYINLDSFKCLILYGKSVAIPARYIASRRVKQKSLSNSGAGLTGRDDPTIYDTY